MKLRDYQREIFNVVLSDTTDDLVQLDTGAGKTPIEAALCEAAEFSLLVAHRNILIQQASEKLAAFGLEHDTISSEHTRRQCMVSHRQHGRNFIRRGHATRLVASIGSLVSHYRHGRLQINRFHPWIIVIDEAHHVVPGNQWGQLRDIFPNARIIGFTATPARMDGESLSVRNGGLFNRLIQAEGLRENSVKKLIDASSLCGFVVYSPQSKFDALGESGTLFIAEDPVVSYRRYLDGKRAIVMCPTIKNAEELAAQYCKAGISAACINSHMSQSDVSRLISMFVASRIKVLCNVDMVGEGFDVPGVEGLIMMRRTGSFIAYRQWIGRTLRPATGKQRAVIVDLVGNVAEHGLPDEHVEWDLDNPPRVPQQQRRAPCEKCWCWYPIKETHCPECGAPNALLDRSEIGAQYLTIKRFNYGLVEEARREMSAREFQQKLETEIVYPMSPFGGQGSIGQIAERLLLRFVDGLKASGVTVKEINYFLQTERDMHFWIKNFTATDAASPNQKKIEKVFRAWQKSH